MKQKGFTLLETLVSLAMIGLIIFTFSSTKLVLLSSSHKQAQQFYALQQLSNIYEILKATHSPHLIAAWQAETAALLPNAKGDVSANTIKISWGKNQVVSLNR